MSEKIILDYGQVESIVNRLNNKECSVENIANEYGFSRKTLNRKISEAGFVYDRNSFKYVKGDNVLSDPPADKKLDAAPVVKVQLVALPKNNLSGETVKRTFALPVEVDKALRRKSVEEDRTVTDILKDFLLTHIEDKYFKSIK